MSAPNDAMCPSTLPRLSTRIGSGIDYETRVRTPAILKRTKETGMTVERAFCDRRFDTRSPPSGITRMCSLLRHRTNEEHL